MIDIRAGRQPAKALGNRSIRLAPMTRAVRSALAVSTIALAMGTAGNAFAAACTAPFENTVVCDQAAIDIAPVVDLTVVDDLDVPVSASLAIVPLSIVDSGPGDVSIDNVDPIEEIDAYYNVVAIQGYSPDGNVDIANHEGGDLVAASGWGSAIGIYAYSATGDAMVDNAASISAGSYYGIADGIFAAGTNVDVSSSGSIETYSYGWTAGIEAESTDSTVVDNSGDINVAASQPYMSYDGFAYYVGAAQGGHATGIYATGGEGGVQVGNSGSIQASGGYVTGIEVVAVGDIAIDNSGSIATGPDPARMVDYSTNPYGIVTIYGAQLADGIEATSVGDGTHVAIGNSGDIRVNALYGSNGISATASGYGSTAEVANSGSIYAGQYVKYGYGAYGVVASADSDSSVHNSGAIEVYSAGAGTGAAALSFAGDASVTNSGDVDVTGLASRYYTTAGLLSFAGNGNAQVDNSGDVRVDAMTYIGRSIDAQGYSGVSVANSGSLYVDAKYGYGVYAVAMGGDTVVTNAAGGEIGFTSIGNGTGIFGVSVGGDVNIDNAGAIEGQATSQAMGVFGLSLSGDVNLSNRGSIDVATSADAALGLFARAWYGTAHVANSGDITVSTFESSEYADDLGYLTYGVLAQGEDVLVENSGDITVYGEAYAAGIAVSALDDAVVVSGDGSIKAYAPGALVVGYVYVPGYGGGGYYGGDGGDGGGYYAQMVRKQRLVQDAQGVRRIQGADYGGGYDGGYGGGYGGSWYYYTTLVGEVAGINAKSTGGDVSVTNASDITVASYLVNASGIKVDAFGDASVANSGDISVGTVYGFADGILVQDYYSYANGISSGPGSLSVANSGDISVVALAPGIGRGSGITASRWTGDLSVQNSGGIDIYSGGRSYGIAASVIYGQVSVTNSGGISMFSPSDAQIGIQATTGSFFYGGGDVSVVNSGDIAVHSDYGFASAIGAIAGSAMQPYGNSYIRNSGAIDVLGQYNAAGIQTRASKGDATIINSGDVSIETRAMLYAYLPDQTVGVAALSFFGGDLAIQNSGDVDVQGYAHSYGLYVKSSNDGTVTISNSGSVHAHSKLAQFGDAGPWGYALPAIAARAVYAYGFYGDVAVNNTGSLLASGGDVAIGVHALTVSGSIAVTNAGDIHAGDSGSAVGVLLGNYALQPYASESWTAGTSTLDNSGSISVDGEEGKAFAVIGNWAADTINNSGDITGAISLYAADDTFNNLAGGLLDLTGRTLDMGDGNDKVTNAAGGTLLLDSGTIAMGGGSNAFTNSGTIVVNGDSLIDMGGDAPATVVGTAGFQTGLFRAAAVSAPIRVAAALNSGPLLNDGTISLANGFVGDTLTIAGDLGGTGAVDIDADLTNGTTDLLHLEGDVAGGAVQTVNVAFTGIPALGAAPVVFAQVDGSAAGGSFVGGEATGFAPSDFLDLDVVVSSQAAATGGTAFSAGVGVAGLNDVGALASNIASGAAGFINSQMGTFRQRLGVNPYGDEGKVLSAFFRSYRDEGDVSPAHVASNFGQDGSFDFRQTVSGNEVGINANVFGDFHAGIVLGNADGRQRLTGDGTGETRMDGMTIGAYATWYVPQGFYVDLAGRKMTADVRLGSAGTAMGTRVDMAAASLEAGYPWKVGNVALVPQLQYTRTEVEGIRALSGEHVDFQSHGGSYSSGRLGLEANTTFQAGAARITPYGSLNAIRMFDGESTYTVAGDYTGSQRLTGTSTMAELGVGVQHGGFGFGVGVNWTDGGAFDGFFGGQANVRYAW